MYNEKIHDKKLGIIITMTEAGRKFLKVAGFHMGDTMFVGERHNILSIKVERIPDENHRDMLAKIHDALRVELRGLPIAFL
jgi:hypothetical protein